MKDKLIALLKQLFDLVKSFFTQKPSSQPVQPPVQPTPPVVIDPTPVPTKPVEPTPVVPTPPVVVIPLPPPDKPVDVPVAPPPVATPAQPMVFSYSDGFTITGSGHPMRNTLSKDRLYTYDVTLPEGMFRMEVDIFEIPGVMDGKVHAQLVNPSGAIVADTDASTRFGKLSIESDWKSGAFLASGKYSVNVIPSVDTALAVVVYF
jgi:hypothetical protein